MELSKETPIYLTCIISLIAKYSHNWYQDSRSSPYGTYYEPYFACKKIETGESLGVTQLVKSAAELKLLSDSCQNS